MKYRFLKPKEIKFGDGWCFAIVNGRLAEIHFKKNHGIWGHGYVFRKDFSKSEQKMITADTKKYVLTYRRKIYFDQLRGIKHRLVDAKKIFGFGKTKKYINF